MTRLSGALCVVLVCAAVLAVAAERAHAGTIVSSPVTDLSVFPGGRVATKQRTLVVDGAPAVRAYLIWQLPATLVDVEHAALFLYTPTGGRGLRVHAMRTSAGVASRLAADRASKLAATLRRTRARSWLNVDVTRFVRSGGSVSFFLAKAGADEMLVTSREGGAAFRPRLVIVTGRGPECTEASVAGSEDTVVAGRLSCVGKRAVTYRATTAPTHGAVTVAANGGFAYTPSENFHGVDGFGFQACEADPPGRSPPRCDVGRVAIRIAPVNDAPTAEALSLRTTEDTPAGVALRASDVDGDPLSFALASQPSHGSAAVDGGTATYAPAENYSGPDSFVYLVSDGNGGTAAAVVSVEVAAVNDRPAALPASATTAEDTPAAVVLGGDDVEGDPLTFEIVAAPTHGSLSGTGAERTYTPAANYHGEDSFTFKVGDGAAESEVATVSLTVTPVNDAPVAADISVRLAEDGSAEVGLSGADADGDPLKFEIVSGPSHGALSGTGATRVYTPAANYHGPDSFTYRVSDGVLTSAKATVALTVERANDAPVCTDVTLATDEEVAAERDPACSDGDGDQLTYSVVAAGTKGTGSMQGGKLRYVPHANANGLDSFTYRASDGSTDSAVATVSVDIRPVNDPPAAHDGALTTSEDTAKALVLGASDVDGDSLTFEIVAGPSHGALSGTGADRTYTPDANYHGEDSFIFRVGDGAAQSEVARVSVTVEAVNDAPTAGSLTSTTLEDVAKEIALAGTDVDGPALSYEIVAAPAHGTLSGEGARRTYTPAPNYHGPDAFTYRATDGTLFSSVATVTLSVAPVNDAPVAAGLSLTVREDGAKDLTLPAADADGDPLSYEIAAGPGHGILTGEGATRTYTPAPNYHGPDSFTFRARDGSLDSNVATVSITVEAVNDAPGCPAAELTVAEDGSGEITPACTDVDGDALTLEVVGQGLKGLASVQGSSIRFAASPNANGDDSFTYRAVDGTATSAVAAVSVRITPVNDAPTCADVELSTDEDVAAERDPSCADVDGDALTYSIAEQAAKGTASVAAGRLRYAPNANANGADSFTYKASDATASSAGARATVTIAAVNDAPTATGRTVTLAEDAEKALTLQASDVDGDPLSFSIVTAPAHGTLSGTGADRTYTPASNYHGSDSFTFRVRDGSLDSNVATVSLEVTPMNDVPVAQPDAYATPSRTVLNVAAPGVLENDNDVDGGSLTALLVSNPTHGTVDVRPDGSFSYDPRAGYHGHDWFTYSASDGTSRSNVVRVTIDVGGTNQTPVAGDLSASTAEDTAKALTLPASDADGDELTYVIVSGPAHGTLSGSGAERTYTPAANYHGPDSFTFRVKDPWAESNVATVSLTVEAVNDAPVAHDLEARTPEDTAAQLTLPAHDVDKDALAVTIVSGPQHGSLSGSGAERTYTPAANYNGPDSFAYRVSDGTADSNVATVTLTVEAVNDAPVADDLAVTTLEDVAKALVLPARDVETVALRFTIVDGPAHGTLSGSGAERTYTPTPNFHGRDSFTFRADDGSVDSRLATVTVTVDPVNDTPSSASITVTTPEDTPKAVTLAGSDVDGDTLTYEIVAAPSHGVLTGSGAERTYTPAQHYHGPDSFTYKVSDGTLESPVATISVTVEAVNDPPGARDLSATTQEDTAKTLTLEATDGDGDELTYEIVSGPAHGTLSGSGTERTYTPPPNYHGRDSFTYKVSDGRDDSNVATVSLIVEAVNDTPVARDMAVGVTEDTAAQLALAVEDVDGDALVFTIVSTPQHGSLSGSGRDRTYTPGANFHGSDSFTYKVSDGSVESNVATVALTVEAVNDAPLAEDLHVTTSEDVAKALALPATDVETAALGFTIVDGPAHGTLSGSGAERTYTPAANFHGADSFTFRADDGGAQSRLATVTVTVHAVNDPPTAAAQQVTTAEDTPKALTLAASDVDGDPLKYEMLTAPSHGLLSGSGGERTYTPAPNFHGSDSFSYRVTDGGGGEATATVTVTVESVNDPPTAADHAAATAEDTAKALTLGATDADGDALTFTVVQAPAHGTLSGSGAERTYTPDADYNGPDELRYTAGDGSAQSAVATVSLSVTQVNDPPSAGNDAGETEEEKALVVPTATLVANDGAGPSNESNQSLSVTGVGSPVGGTVELAAGDVTFTPARNFNGAASFSYTVADDGVTGTSADPKTATGTMIVNVTPVNDRPVAELVSKTTNEDESVTFALAASDADGDTLAFTIVSSPAHGSVTAPSGNEVTYTPAANFHGADSFSFIAGDGASESDPAVVSLTVTSVNDAPALDTSGSPQLTPVNANANDPAGDTVAEILASGAGGDQMITDVDGDPKGIAVTSVDGSGGTWEYRPAGGSWTAVGGVDAAAARLLDVDSRVRFRPAPGFIGGATMRFRAWDRSSGSVGATADTTANGGASAFSADVEEATITVIPNSLPVASDDSVETTEDTEVAIDVLANDSDPDGTPLTVAEVTPPDDGTATIVDGVVRYRPHPNVNGTDRFSYTVRDAAGAVATAKVDIMVTAENDAPIARGDAERVAEDGIVVFDPTGNDVAGPLDESGGAVTLRAITSPPQHGVAVIPASLPDAGKIRYTPTPGFTGTDVVTYEVCDDATPALCGEARVDLTVSRVAATIETDPVPHRSSASTDAADDIAIWVDPNEPSRSVVIGTNKFTDSSTSGGLLVYDLNGTQLAYTNDGRMNNVDLRSGFTLGGEQATLVAASRRTNGTANPPTPRRIVLYRFDGSTRTLVPVHSFEPTFEPLGLCMYRSAKTGNFSVFVTAANGWVEQYQLSATPGGAAPMAAAKVREFRVSTPPTGSTQDVVEGCVADDDLGHLYVSEEDAAIWRYSAEPDGGDARTQVDAAGGGQLTADIEGLAIANGPGDTGYLIASSQGSNSYAVYRRDGSNAFVRSFKIKDGAVDGTTFTDGIEVTSADLGPAFPNGMFVAQDNGNLPANQNFKLVPLEQIVPTAGLGSNGSCARPYTDASPWNTPIAAGAPVHPQSADHVAAITGPLTSDPTQFTFPVYEVDATTPRQTVTLTGWFSNVTNGGRTLANQRAGTVELPIPPGAVPPGGDDDQIIMVDPWTGDEWGFSRATPNETTGGWTGWNAYHYSTRWSAVPPYDASGRPFIPRGAGLPYLAGLVRPCELARGRIDHALAFAYDFPTSEFVYPASKSDGTSAGFPHMPQGSRLQLDPTLTAGELGAMGCTGHCLTIARALQVYGMYVVDSSRRPKVMLEFEGTAGWGGAVTAATVSPIPISAFRLLQS